MSLSNKFFSGKDKKKDNDEAEYLAVAYDSLSDGSELDPDKILDENGTSDIRLDFDTDDNSSYSSVVGEGIDLSLDGVGQDGLDGKPESELETEASGDTESEYDRRVDELITAVMSGDTGEMNVDEINRAAEKSEELVEEISDEIFDENSDEVSNDISDENSEDTALEAFDEASEDEKPDFSDESDEENAEIAEEFTEEAVSEDNFDGDFGEPYTDYGTEFDRDETDLLPDNAYYIDSGENFEDIEGSLSDENHDESVGKAADDTELMYSAYAPKNVRPQVTERTHFDLDDIEDKSTEKKEKRLSAFVKSHKPWIIGIGAAVAVVLIVLIAVFAVQLRMDPLGGYAETYPAKGNVIKTMSASGNVEPYSKYNITSLVSGTITESPLNVGETVLAGELVYKIDDTNAQLAVQQAENSVKRAQTSSTSTSTVSIYANASGVISDLNITTGSRVSGGQVATITQSNGTEIPLIPSVTGTVQAVAVREGATVTSGQVIATVKSDSSSAVDSEIDLESSKLQLEQAEKELEKYKIASPIDGTILTKNAKVGDNVVVGQDSEPLMVIADMSRMKFTIEVDELDIWNIELGQTVVITAAALPGETFSGEITNIAGEGEQKGNGVTAYDVEITISEPGKLKSGMNVEARIIVNSAINVLTLPIRALYESDGTSALVITDAAMLDNEEYIDPDDYPNIFVPDGYRLLKVKYGLSDGTYVEITSGLTANDKVLYVPDDSDIETQNLVESTSSGDDADTYTEDGGENVKSTGLSATTDDIIN